MTPLRSPHICFLGLLLGLGAFACTSDVSTSDDGPRDEQPDPATTVAPGGQVDTDSDSAPDSVVIDTETGSTPAIGGPSSTSETSSSGTSTTPPSTTPGGAKFEPPDGRTLLIIGQNKQPMQEYVSDLGVPSGFMTYTSIFNLNGFNGVETCCMEGAEDRMDFAYWPATHDNIVMQVAIALNDSAHVSTLNSGGYDGALNTLANSFKTANVPVYLRVGYEVNGKFPSAGYPEAFRYVRDYLEDQGVDNVAYVWHVTPGYTTNGIDNHFDWYPGDDSVDWIAISYFLDTVGRFAPNDASQSGYLDELTNQHVQTNLAAISNYAVGHDIPLMIAEASPQKLFEPALGQISWDGWFEPLFDYIERYDVKALSYINQRWSDVGWPEHIWGDSRVQTDDLIESNWTSEVSGERYLHAADNLHPLLGFPR